MVITGSRYYKYSISTSLITFISILSKWMLQHTTLQDIHTLQPPTPPSNASTHYGQDLKGGKKAKEMDQMQKEIDPIPISYLTSRGGLLVFIILAMPMAS